MQIHRLLQQGAFSPEDLDRVVSVYEDCLRVLKLTDQPEAIKEAVAKTVMEIARSGVRDANQMRKLALKALEVPPAA